MPFYPDIVVTEPDSSHTLLVVETKMREASVDDENQLQDYMWRMSCPIGLLASPKAISLFRNLFTDHSNDSVVKIGSFPAPSAWSSYSGRGLELEFERHVQNWLESLTSRQSDVNQETAEVLEQLVVPSLLDGDIHAAGPRVSR